MYCCWASDMGQTDRQMDGSQHCLMLPTIGAGIINIRHRIARFHGVKLHYSLSHLKFRPKYACRRQVSVRLSVTNRCLVKRLNRVKQTAAHDSPATLVFWRLRLDEVRTASSKRAFIATSEGVIKVTGSHVHFENGIITEKVLDRTLTGVRTLTGWYTAYLIAAIAMTLDLLERHSSNTQQINAHQSIILPGNHWYGFFCQASLFLCYGAL